MQFGEYDIIHYTPYYRDAALDLLSLLWGSNFENNVAYLQWKYDQNPFADREWIYLALYGGQPVGILGNMAMRWQVDDPVQYIDCMCNVDGVVKPEHRRKGLFEAMCMHNLRDLEGTSFRYFVTLSANAKSAPAIIKLGWQPLGSIQTFVRLNPRTEASESSLRKAVRQIPLFRNAYTVLKNVVHRPPNSRSQQTEGKQPFSRLDDQNTWRREDYPKISIEEVARPVQMADLIARLPTKGRICHVRDSEYFTWRYLNPRSNYRFLFWGDEQLDGYMILQSPNRPDVQRVNIVDWEACDMDVQKGLLQAAIHLGGFDILTIWGISLTTQTKELLLELGFVQETEKTGQDGYQPEILLRPVVPDLMKVDWQLGKRNLLDLQNWDFRPIYADTF